MSITKQIFYWTEFYTQTYIFTSLSLEPNKNLQENHTLENKEWHEISASLSTQVVFSHKALMQLWWKKLKRKEDSDKIVKKKGKI